MNSLRPDIASSDYSWLGGFPGYETVVLFISQFAKLDVIRFLIHGFQNALHDIQNEEIYRSINRSDDVALSAFRDYSLTKMMHYGAELRSKPLSDFSFKSMHIAPIPPLKAKGY